MDKPKIILKPLYHRSQERVAIAYHNDSKLQTLIRSIPNIKWSQTNRCWHMPLTDDYEKNIRKVLPLQISMDTVLVDQYLAKKKIVNATLPNTVNQAGANALPTTPAWALSEANLEALRKFVEQLKLKSYSASTIRTYRNEFIQLLALLKSKPVNDLTTDDLRRYMVYAMEKLGISENTAHSRLNALKFYFEQVLGPEKFFFDIPRPKKVQQLPSVFSQAEVAAIINNVGNKKHKAMVMLAYGAGLRVSEIVSLKTHNIDSKRMTIFISAAKGKKDRIVSLSPALLVMLRAYAEEYKPDKKGYLFEGLKAGQPYNVRSLQEVLQVAKRKAGIIRPGGIHSLRHSFATHLIEKGTDVTLIQKLLGHNNIQTTLIYLHTSNKDLLKVISPLDDLPIL